MKTTKKDGKKNLARASRKKKKPSYPKQMTIRYDAKQENEINKLMLRLNQNTMSKTFLKTPEVIEEQVTKIAAMAEIIDKQRERIFKLESIVKSWAEFYNKLEDFTKKR